MAAITSEKTYTGQQLSDIFFRTTFSGKSATELGLRVVYNLPVPTTLTLWSLTGDGIKPYESGFQGENQTKRVSKTVDMTRCKIENAFSPSDYEGRIYELITNDPNVNLQDLSGSDLERAETELFRRFIRENIRVQMWVGNSARKTTDDKPGKYSVFDGLLKKALDTTNYKELHRVTMSAAPTSSNIISILDSVWNAAPAELKEMKSGGDLAYFATSDVLEAYEAYLDSKGNSAAYADLQKGRDTLQYHGIRIVEAQVDSIIAGLSDMPDSFVLLAPKQNLVLSLNTANMPDAEVRMWYNPDQIENRQRCCFLAGTEFLDENLVVFASKAKATQSGQTQSTKA